MTSWAHDYDENEYEDIEQKEWERYMKKDDNKGFMQRIIESFPGLIAAILLFILLVWIFIGK